MGKLLQIFLLLYSLMRSFEKINSAIDRLVYLERVYMEKVNRFVICVGTRNGSGSQSANSVLLRSLFRMGVPVGGKNVFPSNIQGMPTWFWIRASDDGYVGRRDKADIVVAMNLQSFNSDHELLSPNSVFIYNDEFPFESLRKRDDVKYISVPVKNIVDESCSVVKMKKFLANIVYVGVLSEILSIKQDCIMSSLDNQFGGKANLLDANLKTLEASREWARNYIAGQRSLNILFKAEPRLLKNKILIDGNTAGALGLLCGGATFSAWYPITPSSSLVESFQNYAEKYRIDGEGKRKFAVVQAEDELSSICMVLGAGWSGARAFTATSGPGLSLMQEAAGFAYYAEIPCVVWDVQRVGPSTGMPTRTAQGDIFAATFASHGDTRFPVLLPGSPKECFEFGMKSLDLAERLQTLVFVLSDLDIGMNVWMEDALEYPEIGFDRGKVLSEKEIAELNEKGVPYFRYQDTEGDGIPYRNLPGTRHVQAAYLTRGSGHNLKAQYTENSAEYLELVNRLSVKWKTTHDLVPKPFVLGQGAEIGLICYGSSSAVIEEVRAVLVAQGVLVDIMRIRAIPFHIDVRKFIGSHEQLVVLDLNRDAQIFNLLIMDFTEFAHKFISIRHYDGTPITADLFINEVKVALEF